MYDVPGVDWKYNSDVFTIKFTFHAEDGRRNIYGVGVNMVYITRPFRRCRTV